jgi:voltage-gated potassium channel
MNSGLNIFSRASEESSVKKLKIAGAKHVVMPDKIGGDHMASLIVSPDLIEFLENLATSQSDKANIQEIILSGLPDLKSIEELKIREKTGCTVIGYKTPDGEYIVNPDPFRKTELDGRIIVLGNDAQITKLNRVFNIQ